MLDNLLEGFKRAYETHGDALISDGHQLKDGLYIKVHLDGTLEPHIFKKAKDENVQTDAYQWFQKRDFLSNYLESNKAIATKPIKRIHSNNYLTWFVKRDTFLESDKTMTSSEIIEMTQSYFDSLSGPALNQPAILEALEGAFSEATFEFCRRFLTEEYDAIEALVMAHKDAFKNYVKVFFDGEEALYKRESNRYFYHKIFNSDAYTVKIEGKPYGLSNFNMGLNSKKPYLEHKTMKCEVPYRISLEEALLGYKYSLYLKNLGYGVRYQLTEEPVPSALSDSIKERDRPQNLLALGQDNGAVVIEDYDIIPAYKDKSTYKTVNVLGYRYKPDKSGDVVVMKSYEHPRPKTLQRLEDDIDAYLFRGQLKRHYFSDANSLKPSQYINQTLVEMLLASRQMLFDCFKKGMEENLKVFVDRYGLILVRNAMSDGWVRGIDAFNTYYSIKLYCKGEQDVNAIQTHKETLKALLDSDGDICFESDALYAFAAGQLAYFLLSKSAASKKNHDAVEPFLNRKTAGQLNDELIYWFKRYAHDIGMYQKRFNKLYAAVLGHDKKAVKQDDMFLAGYLSSNLFYEKKEMTRDEE